MTVDKLDGLAFRDGTKNPVTGRVEAKTLPMMLIEDGDPHGRGMEKIKGSPCHVSEIVGFVDLLRGGAARTLYNTRQANTVLEVDRPDGKGGVTKDFRPCVYLCKPVVMEDDSGPPQHAIDWLASAFDLLVRNEMVGFGMLAPAMWLRLQDLDDGTMRALVLLYTYPTFKVAEMAKERDRENYFDVERSILNEFLNCEAFAEEGVMGDGEWPELPKGFLVNKEVL